MIQNYLRKLSQLYFNGNATEHSYRGDLQTLLQEILGKEFSVINEPQRQACGAPDYIISKKDIPVGFIEAKDLKLGIDHKKNKPQFDRYRNALSNLIITDYLNFEFYRNGELTNKISLGDILGNEIAPQEENFALFINLIKDFSEEVSQNIKNSERLAEMMANKAKLISDIIYKTLNYQEEHELHSDLMSQKQAFHDMLIHDIDNHTFADLYAQTIAYGLFVARYHDPTLPTFSRLEAANLIPKSNPFLRKLFQHIAGFDLDENLKIFVDDLIEIFKASDVLSIMRNFGKSTRQEDPVIHFYETFLGKYNPALRKARGVWYTPQPVVNFIVRAVDDLLKTEFNLPMGLADASKLTKKVELHGKKVDKTYHKVQVLDPATGTGTFLAETIRYIYDENFRNINEGAWNSYVEKDLIPRMNGFELLMASYSMAHLKLDMLLSETGYETNSDQRFNVFLTNSLEEHHQDTGTLFASWLSDESNMANQIKKDTPVMCVIGNPPYSGESSNKSDWIMRLMEDYKKEPGGKEKLKEKNSKWINDDYVKFIRFAQHLVEKNEEGIVAFINPHGFLDNPTFRGMRWNLLKTFDKIYTIDLHGNSKKKETSPDGSPDQNVFDIMQGVSINIFVKTNKKAKDELGKVFHYDLYGKRNDKYAFLLQNNFKTIPFKVITNKAPMYFMVRKDFEIEGKYNIGFSLIEIYIENSLGVLSKNDDITIDFEKEKLKERILDFRTTEDTILRNKYSVKSDSRDWILSKAISDLKENHEDKFYKSILYRPFDSRFTFFTGRPKGFFAYSQNRIMKNMHDGNFALISGRQGQAVGSMPWNLSFITNTISDQNVYYRGGGTVFPLYLKQQPTELDLRERIPNFNPEILKQIEQALVMKLVEEEHFVKVQNFDKVIDGLFTPLDVLDYIYAALHSPKYRETYKEFLKIDFPRVPFPKPETFWQLVQLGSQIRQLHLLEGISNKNLTTKFSGKGENVVEKPTFVRDAELTTTDGVAALAMTGKVYINPTQYFENIPESAWNFYIGGYQPAQKWLKDRKGRTLDFQDVLHYQKMIYAMSHTERLMGEIDEVGVV
ncbi:type ISP restriction/modification enzyme [Kaistella sp.]|uniref:type ISP restriction/modification enzyme n=1 Tax=Kaistella sp. TaxID=2782235 RepID=UPI002F932811